MTSNETIVLEDWLDKSGNLEESVKTYGVLHENVQYWNDIKPVVIKNIIYIK